MLLLSVIVLLFAIATADVSENLKQYQEGNLQFSIDAFKELIKNGAENTLICPLSADIALAMALIGATGETQNQLANGIHLHLQPEQLKQTFSELLLNLQSNNKYTFELANKIYVQDQFNIQEDYRQTLINYFKSDIENVDFKQKSNAVSLVNNWVAQKTHGKIRRIMENENLDENTRLLILNALYFKGEWVKGFETKNTKKHKFYINKSQYVLMDMMSTTANFRHYRDFQNKAEILEMAYKGNDVAMTIVLPDDPEGLSTVEQNLEKFIKRDIPFSAPIVNLRLPKFKINSHIGFTEILKSLGVDLPFQHGATFSGIVDENQDEQLKISDIVQQTLIEVDEQGTVAAAVTAGVSRGWRKSLRPRKVNFYANRPFLFYMKHKLAGVIFIGRYSKPSGIVENGQ